MTDRHHRRRMRSKKALTLEFLKLLFLTPVVLIPTEASDLSAEPVLVRQTQIGQRMPIFLDDSCQLILGGDTRITLDDTPGLHRLTLEKGELSANVRHSDNRRFEILMGQLVILDVGTQFVATRHDDISNVSVTEGQLRLFQRGPNGEFLDPIVVDSGVNRREPAVLDAGDQARVEQLSDGTLVVNKDTRDLNAAARRMQWVRGKVDTEGRRLDELVWEFNRYNLQQIVIDDPQIAPLTLGGIHELGNVDGFVKSLVESYHIRVTLESDNGGMPSSYHLQGAPRHTKGRK
jgi:transmembrane sensor